MYTMNDISTENQNNYKNIKNIYKYARRYFPWALVAVLVSVLFSLLEVFKADALREIVDIAQKGDAGGVLPVFLRALLIIAAIMICVFLSRYSAGRFSTGVMRDIKAESARRIESLPIGFMTSNRRGELLSKMSSDADTVEGFLEGDFIKLIELPFTIIFYTVYLITLNPILFLICFVSVPILVPLGASFSIPFKNGSKKYMKYLGRVSNIVADMAGGISVVKSYNLEDSLSVKYSSGIKRATDMALNNDKYQHKGMAMFNLARNIPTLTCLIAGGYMCFKGSFSIGSLVAFSTLLSQTLSPLMRSSAMFFNLRYSSAAADRMFSIINEQPEPDDGQTPGELSKNAPAIRFEDVCFEYEKGMPVLKGINLDVELGETIGFAGSSGCGKSTLLGLVCGFYRPTGGSIFIGGVDMNDRNLKSTRSLISYVSQEAYLFPVSIYDNIAMGKADASREEVIAAAKAAYAHDFIMETEDGYDTVVGERGNRLSGGQVQRISIARAMLKNAPILLLDEATSALDVKAEAEVQQAIDNLSQGKTVLVVAHRLSTIRNSDRIAVIDDGVIAECGNHDELLKQNGIYVMLTTQHGD